MSDQTHIASIRLNGVFEHQQLLADFHPGLNLVHGKNGSGKTTLLHVLANLLEGDLYRFCMIDFNRLIVRLDDGTEITLEQARDTDPVNIKVSLRGENLGTMSTNAPVPELITKSIRELFPTRPVYLPAFRSILEAASEREELAVYGKSARSPEFEAIRMNELRYLKERSIYRPEGMRAKSAATASKTILSRRWFGDFVPTVRYPSLADVSRQLREEAVQAYFEVNQYNQETFATIFRKVLQAVLEKNNPQVGEDVKSLLGRVQKHLKALAPEDSRGGDIYAQIAALIEQQGPLLTGNEEIIRAVLQIYDSALDERAKHEEKAYQRLRLLELSFDRFIKPKSLRTVVSNARRSGPEVVFPNGYKGRLEVLSSGERQVLTMLFCATHMSPADGTMLIDEPEISLHVDWQRIILNEIIRQAGDRQIIVCTHSPEVVAEHLDALVKLGSEPWSPEDGVPITSDGETESVGGD